MLVTEVHDVFTNIQNQAKLASAEVQFPVLTSGGITQAIFRLNPTSIMLFTNPDSDSGIIINHDSLSFSTEHQSRNWNVMFCGRVLTTMESDADIVFQELITRTPEIITILTKDYAQEILDLDKHSDEDLIKIEQIKSHVFKLT